MKIQSTLLCSLLGLFLIHSISAQSDKKDPSFEEVISLKSAGTPIISPDGRHVVFSISRADWKENRYDSELWLSKDGGAPFQLTNTPKGSSFSPQWSPDGQWIAFLASRGEKTQLHAIRVAGGEARVISNAKEGVSSYALSPDGRHIAFTMSQPEDKADKNRKERYGAYETDDEEFKLRWLYKMAFQPELADPSALPCYDAKDEEAQAWDCLEFPEVEALIDSVEFTISNFKWSPDGKKIAVQHQPDPLINSFFNSDISIFEVESKKIELAVANPSADGFIDWSPDSKQILFSSSLENRTSNYYENRKLFIKELTNSKTRPVAANFDENIYGAEWTEKGIFASAYQKTTRPLLRIDPQTGKASIWGRTPRLTYGFTCSKGGGHIAYMAENGDDLREIYLTSIDQFKPRKLTDFSSQIADWQVAQSEVISWKSEDGATIEGILHKPQNYDPNKKYPLLVVIHGGPTGIDRPTPVPAYVYPIVQWLNKGALVLRPNYRGSAGYGEKFRSLNVRNLGVGDAWDVLSGVDYLAEQGLIDTDRMGAMGWSQGGYISAFLTTTSKRFKAISVGAGISNWMTYYVNTDIHPFTRQYLKGTPWDDEEVYKKTSPMTYINQASTPTLIQHGEFDRRVPIPNAYELLQGLRDVDVPAKLIVYKGFGHGISKPKERLAATWHNWQWFNKYVWGEEAEIPLGMKE